ncbi:MAG: preprotein translocase subunit SecE [Clostridia bacterium]|nr:preprotein translocase subunit SecE [Clostridia bacterium]
MAEETKKVTEKTEAKPAKKKSDKPGFFKRIGNFFRDYKSEMKKIVWYPFKDVVRDTGVVMVSLVISGVLIGVLDLIFTNLILFLGQIG